MTTQTLENSPCQAPVGYLFWTIEQRSFQKEIAEFLTLGRDVTNQIALEDPFISARHFRIERRDGLFVLRDLRSRNGTYLNGARVMEAVLSEGDTIRLGGIELRFGTHRPEMPKRPILSSKNASWRAQIGRLPTAAQFEYPVLLTGPSGSGKDVIAQELHAQSFRKRGPFVAVNCSALSESLVESELFGHVRGSFTGATGDRKGAFEAARGGTLFLDEIGDLPATLQPKLLRALENNQIRPVGSDRNIDTDVRIVAATHRDLKRAVLEGRFRSDLFYRLNVLQIPVPALAERMEDFEDLFYQFARDAKVRFSVGAILRMREHKWPGNIRELKNTVYRAKAIFGAEEVLAEHVGRLLDVFPHEPEAEAINTRLKAVGRSVIKEIEYEMIKTRLLANHGNQRRTAQELGMAKSTLHDRIRTYGINVEELLKENPKV